MHHSISGLIWLVLSAGCATPVVTSGSTSPSHLTTTSPHLPKPGRWRSHPPMLNTRAAHAVVATEDMIYALGGTGQDGPVLGVEHFDGRTWTLETTLPGAGLNAPAAAILGRKLYLIGGFNTTTNIPSSTVWVYDLDQHTWEESTPLPSPRGGHAVAVLDGQIHVVGGGNSESTIADHTVFDPSTQGWTNRAPLPRSQGSPALVAFAGKLYAIGGRSGFSDFGDVYLYDPTSDTWSSGPSIPPRGTTGAAVYCGNIYLFGGESQVRGTSLEEVYRLDLTRGEWQERLPLPHARTFARAVPFQGEVYVVGGSLTAGSSHTSPGSDLVESYGEDCGEGN